jgi:hypothetical protein
MSDVPYGTGSEKSAALLDAENRDTRTSVVLYSWRRLDRARKFLPVKASVSRPQSGKGSQL